MSPSKIEANRLNAQKSTGPRTEAGKKISSQNARTHGLTGRVAVLDPEDQLAYAALAKRYIAEQQPRGILEEQLVQTIVDAHWQLNCAHAIQQSLLQRFTRDALSASRGQLSTSDAAAIGFRNDSAGDMCLEKLSRYEARTHRMLLKTIDEFRKQQALRHAREQAQASPEKVTKNARPKPPAEPAPAPGGFVSSESPTYLLFDIIETEILERAITAGAA
jgi:hypothetical protein